MTAIMAISASTPACDAGIDNPLDDLLGYHLRRASAVLMTDLSVSLADVSLTPTEASVLLLIERNPGATQSDIGRVLAIKRANMAPIAATLTTRELVDRSRPNGRSQGLRLSPAGAALVTDVRRRIATHEARFLPGLPPSERDALRSLLKRIWSLEPGSSDANDGQP